MNENNICVVDEDKDLIDIRVVPNPYSKDNISEEYFSNLTDYIYVNVIKISVKVYPKYYINTIKNKNDVDNVVLLNRDTYFDLILDLVDRIVVVFCYTFTYYIFYSVKKDFVHNSNFVVYVIKVKIKITNHDKIQK